jgi:hypothetical protein
VSKRDIDVTPEQFFDDAEADLVGFGSVFEQMRGMLPDEMVDGLQRVNEGKLAEVRKAKRTIKRKKKS